MITATTTKGVRCCVHDTTKKYTKTSFLFQVNLVCYAVFYNFFATCNKIFTTRIELHHDNKSVQKKICSLLTEEVNLQNIFFLQVHPALISDRKWLLRLSSERKSVSSVKSVDYCVFAITTEERLALVIWM